MNKYVSYETAVLLKKVGYDEPCQTVYHEDITTRVFNSYNIREGSVLPAPLLYDVVDWLFEKYGYIIHTKLLCSCAYWQGTINSVNRSGIGCHTVYDHIGYSPDKYQVLDETIALCLRDEEIPFILKDKNI
jgi:hypothetical protein